MLEEKPETVVWPDLHYVFIEKLGPFKDTAQAAWQEYHKIFPGTGLQPSGVMALYRMDEAQPIYRAGAALDAKPADLPSPLKYEFIAGGKFTRFTLIGSYAQLPEASGRIFEIVAQMNLPKRSAFNIEHYVNDPQKTPVDFLITQVSIPIA